MNKVKSQYKIVMLFGRITMPGEQITSGQLTGLRTHHNANYATRELEVQLYGKYAKANRLFIHQHLLTNHPP